MAPLPEDDVRAKPGTPGDRHVEIPDDTDDTTTAEAGPPASHLREEREHDADDRTVQQKVEPPGVRPRAPAVPKTVPKTPPPGAGTAGPATLASPPSSLPPATLPSSVPPPPPPATVASPSGPATSPMTKDVVEEIELEDDEEALEDSITTMAPRLSVSMPGIVIPGSVEIRTVEHDELLDETEVRTRPGTGSQPLSPPRPAAGVPASAAVPSTLPEEDDDGVTTQAPAPGAASSPALVASLGIAPTSSSPVTEPQAPITQAMDSVEEPATRPGVESAEEPKTRPGVESAPEQPTRPGLGDPPTSPRKLPRLDSYANEDDDESVTTRGPAVGYEEDSVTTQAPAFSEQLVAAANARRGPKTVADATLDDGTEGTTKKLKTGARKAMVSSPADSESESITTQAPGPLTNMLRVIASDISDDGVPGPPDDEEPLENRTAVMANAPLNRIIAEITGGSGAMPAIRPTGPPLTMPHGSSGARASAAPQLAPTSESGLRVARAAEEHASLGALGAADGRPSGIARSASPSGPRDPRPYAATEAAFPAQQPSVHDVDLGKGPRYGLLVGIVAVISIVVPVTLFVVLKGRAEEVTAGTPAEAASEFQQHDATPRGKVDKKAPPPAPSASASASASSSGHKSGPRPPFGRR